MKFAKIAVVLFASSLLTMPLFSQTPAVSAKTLPASNNGWPTYNGDYSGRRFSHLSKINESNVKSLTLAWSHRISPSGGGSYASRISATPLEVGGVLYFSVPNFVWAVDARTGVEVWHYDWKSKGGRAI
jgi:glucose dehydrogenase